MKITFYTVITGEYDNLRKPGIVDPSCTYLCFADRPRIAVFPWQVVPFPQPHGFDTARNARVPKCLPHLLMDGTDISVYMDGAFVPNAAAGVILKRLGDADIAMYEHPNNHKCIADEVQFYQNLHGFVPDHVKADADKYAAMGVQSQGEFWAGGWIIRRHNALVASFNERWYRDYVHGSYNDQLSLHANVIMSGLKVNTLRGNILADSKFPYCLHANSGCGDNPHYEAENRRWQMRTARIKELVENVNG